jgi:hypothetical protein
MAGLGFLRSFSLVLATTGLTIATITGVSPLRTLAQTPSDSPKPACPTELQPGTPAGDRPVVREDFATGLNACINQVDDLSRQGRTGAAAKTDLEALIQRQRELNLELRSINERLGNLDNP